MVCSIAHDAGWGGVRFALRVAHVLAGLDLYYLRCTDPAKYLITAALGSMVDGGLHDLNDL